MAKEYKYDVFLSHNSQDKAEVEEIATFLKEKGNIRCWLDSWFITYGDSINDKLTDGLKSSATIAVFYGRKGKGAWQDEEIKVAINWSVNKDVKVIPILLPGFQDPVQNIDIFLQDKLYVDLRDGIGQRGVLNKLIGIIRPEKKVTIPKQRIGERSDAPDLGPLSHKLCNRRRQSDKFELVIKDVFRKRNVDPKFFIIHGLYNEKHASLVDRYRDHTLKSLLSDMHGKSVMRFETVKWPDSGEFEYQKKYIYSYYEKTFGLKGAWTTQDIYSQREVNSQQVVIIQHTINASEWDKNSSKLLQWFMSDFWEEMPAGHKTYFLVFFNVLYNKPVNRGIFGFLSKSKIRDKKNILGELKEIAETKPEHCYLIEELRKIKRTHVQQWVDDHKLDEYAHHLADSLFASDEGNSVDRKAMSEIEPELKKLIDWIKDEEAKHYLRYE